MLGKKTIQNIYTQENTCRKKSSLVVSLIFLITGVILYSLFFGFRSGESTSFTPKADQAEIPRVEETSLPVSVSVPEPVVPEPRIISSVITRGDTVARLLGPYLSALEIHNLAQACTPVFPLTRIRSGQPYSIILEDDRLLEFEYEINTEQRLQVRCLGDDFDVHTEDIHYDIKREVVSGVITASLSEALDRLH